MEIRPLRANDHRAEFTSGDEALDRFFRHYAGQNQFRHYLGVTYVAVEAERILGFVSVAPRHIMVEDLPTQMRKKLPHYPIPVLGLARLAVSKEVQGGGLGTELLRYVLLLALKMADEVGCAGVVVDAKPTAVAYYQKFGFEAFEALEGQSDARPAPVAMWLAIQTINKALAPT